MASRVLANLLVACSGAVFRAASQAWSKALQNAKASGVHAEHVAAGKSSSKVSSATTGVSLDEAKKILPLANGESKEEMIARFERAFAKNDGVSFYLQSKLFRAKETLGKEVFGMTEEEASADPRTKTMKTTEEEDNTRNGEGEKKKALPNDVEKVDDARENTDDRAKPPTE